MSWLSSLFTSRYTRSLEDRVRELRQQIDQKDAEIQRLQKLLIPGLSHMEQQEKAQVVQTRSGPVIATRQGSGTLYRDGTTGKPIKAGNWLRSLGTLEDASDERHVAHDPVPSTRRNSDNEE